tara:strand:- start:110 stop:340 length:231 start_codon:yes stop_codon:yes gene_type:complete
MNDITVFIYLTFFVAIFGMTFAFMFKMVGSTLNDFNKPMKRNVHPEMSDVKSGEQLLVFKSQDEEDDDGDIIFVRK